MTKIEVSGVCERDIDLLLLEEFVASQRFFDWFISRIGISPSAELTRLARSVTTSNGESDLELTIQTHDGVVKILVENKVDADFQSRQAERYRERAANYLRDGVCNAAVTVIIAPNDYFRDDDEAFGFDHRISYEDVLNWFQNNAELGPRAHYKLALLALAIDRGGAGWQFVPDETVTAFWGQYWELAKFLAPDLRMPRPEEKPMGSNFILFKPAGLPADIKLLHKVTYGNVDLQFAAMGKRVADLEQRYVHRLNPGMRVEQAGKSAVVRMLVPLINMKAPFSESAPAVREGLRAAVELLKWYRAVAE